MEHRKFSGKDISLLGFGLMRLPPDASGAHFEFDYDASEALIDHAMRCGINYYDTAYTYGGSEAVAGRALSRHPRSSYYLATKCPPWKVSCPDDFERIFSEQQERCKTDYFDFYLVHNLAKESSRAEQNEASFAKFESSGMYDLLRQKKAEGKIRHLGFSFHGTPALLRQLVDKYEWDFAQIQLNYIDWAATDAKTQYAILAERSIPVIIMEPLRGGTLATLSEAAADILRDADPGASIASWGIRYAASLPNVVTVLSGMNELSQLTDNIATMNSFRPVTEDEKALLSRVATVYGKSGAVPCTGCCYCLPCPVGVNIPRVFSVYNHAQLLNFRIPFDNGYATLSESEKASACTRCGTCAQKCPQHLDIPGYMREVDEYAMARE